MGKRPERPLLKEGDPYAELMQGEWMTWYVYIHHGVMTWGPEGGPNVVWGTRKRAMLVAERLLRKYIRQELRRQAPRIRINSDEYYKGVQTNRALEELRDPELAWDRDFQKLSVDTSSLISPNERRSILGYQKPPKPPKQIPNAGIGNAKWSKP